MYVPLALPDTNAPMTAEDKLKLLATMNPTYAHYFQYVMATVPTQTDVVTLTQLSEALNKLKEDLLYESVREDRLTETTQSGSNPEGIADESITEITDVRSDDGIGIDQTTRPEIRRGTLGKET